MAVSRALRRLLVIRGLEEEQHRLALESALGKVHSLESALASAVARGRRARELVQANSSLGECTDRQAGLVEAGVARRDRTALAPRIAAAHAEAGRLREAFLEKRVERRQAETLIEEIQARDAIESGRRSQQAIDEWYLSRLRRQQSKLDAQAKPGVNPQITIACRPSQVQLERESVAEDD